MHYLTTFSIVIVSLFYNDAPIHSQTSSIILTLCNFYLINSDTLTKHTVSNVWLFSCIRNAYCTGTEEIPHKSVVNKVAQQLQKALTEKGFALLVNHGIQEEKVRFLLVTFQNE